MRLGPPAKNLPQQAEPYSAAFSPIPLPPASGSSSGSVSIVSAGCTEPKESFTASPVFPGSSPSARSPNNVRSDDEPSVRRLLSALETYMAFHRLTLPENMRGGGCRRNASRRSPLGNFAAHCPVQSPPLPKLRSNVNLSARVTLKIARFNVACAHHLQKKRTNFKFMRTRCVH